MQLAAETQRSKELELELNHHRAASSQGIDAGPVLNGVSGDHIASLHCLIKTVMSAGIVKASMCGVCASVLPGCDP